MRPAAILVIAASTTILAAACSSFHESAGVGGDAARDAGSVRARGDAEAGADAHDAGKPDATSTRDGSRSADAGRVDGRAPDAGPSMDAATSDALHANDARPDGAMHDGPSPDGAREGGISSLLALPSADAAPCMPVGSEFACTLGMCLIANASATGRCQTCSLHGGNCGGHLHGSCVVAEDCDSLFACYHGECDTMCSLDAGQVCGGATCTNVGNAFQGICVP